MNVTPQARFNMIDGQLEPNNVTDAQIVAVMGATPREQFVPESHQHCAYADAPVPLKSGRYMSSPLTMAKLLQLADPFHNEKALVVAGGTGYSAMLLAGLGCQVTMIEEDRELADRARRILSEQQCKNVDVMTGSHHIGDNSHAPYDIILIDGAVEVVPEALCEQLAEHGRLVTVHSVSRRPGSHLGLCRAMVIQHQDGHYFSTEYEEVSAALLDEFKAEEGFSL